MAMRKAASVFPEPVGAITSACSPLAIACQAAFCTGVGAVKAAENQRRVAGENRAKTVSDWDFNIILTASRRDCAWN
ncbi:hypothetical protein ACJ2_27030 [Pantoea sp. QMID2]|nr:hypothetical protein ACJ3_30620 [Pantoea sp. QMID3]GME58885.1 hypothetical protein ACJ2_27030 [Pantoea sp. QMID2]